MKKVNNAINDENFIEELNVSKEEKQLEISHKRSIWGDEKEEVDDYSKDPILEEILLYDNCKTLEENFENDSQSKYILVEVKKNGSMSIDSQIPDNFSKFVVDITKVEEYNLPEFLIVDYDTIFGTRLTAFINYNSNFLTCDERVFFEALLIKYRCFDFKPFYWSKEVIWKELGIKKDRVNRIIKRFTKLDIISTEVKKSFLDGRPQQITYFDLNANKICELLPQIYIERESNVSQIDEVKKYLGI